MRLTVPHFQQERSNTCGLAALRMLFGYYKDIVSEKDLLKDIKVHSFGSFTTDLGLIALSRGYKVTIYTLHLPQLGSLNLPFGTELTIKDLDKIIVKPKDKMNFDSWKKYLKAGGKMYWETTKVSLIEKLINDKIPVIININTSALGNFWKHWNNGHYLVVNDISENDVSVLDPDMPSKKAIYKINKEILLPAWAINARDSAGHLMIIEK